MSLSKQQWEELEQELGYGYMGRAILMAGEDKITLNRGLISNNQIGISVYINDVIKPSWGVVDMDCFNPIVKQLWRKRSRSLKSNAVKQEYIKAFGKRRAHKEFNINAGYEWYEPYFTTFGALRRLYNKLDNIQLVSIGNVAEEAS